jgi:methionyl aminopeptidase
MLKPRLRLKTRQEIDEMRPANRLVAEVLSKAKLAVKPGVTTGEIDALIDDLFARAGAVPLFKGYQGSQKRPFPAATCISVNEEVVHGVPGSRVLKEGDIVTLDTGCRFRDWCGDSAITVPVGKIAPDRQKLWDVAEETLRLAIREIPRCRKWSQVARKMADYVHAHGFSVVEQFVGHGIGRTMHEDPQVPNYDARSWNRQDFWLDEGLVIAVEPMVNMGKKDVVVLPDDWTVVTRDRKPSVHVEHVLAITTKGVEILTDRSEFEQ